MLRREKRAAPLRGSANLVVSAVGDRVHVLDTATGREYSLTPFQALELGGRIQQAAIEAQRDGGPPVILPGGRIS